MFYSQTLMAMKRKNKEIEQTQPSSASGVFSPFTPILRLLGFEEDKSVLHGCINLLNEYANAGDPDVAQFLLAKLKINKDDLIDLLADVSAGKGAKSGDNPVIEHLLRTVSATFSSSGLVPAKGGLDIGDALKLARTIKKISTKRGDARPRQDRAPVRPERMPPRYYDLDDDDYSFL